MQVSLLKVPIELCTAVTSYFKIQIQLQIKNLKPTNLSILLTNDVVPPTNGSLVQEPIQLARILPWPVIGPSF